MKKGNEVVNSFTFMMKEKIMQLKIEIGQHELEFSKLRTHQIIADIDTDQPEVKNGIEAYKQVLNEMQELLAYYQSFL